MTSVSLNSWMMLARKRLLSMVVLGVSLSLAAATAGTFPIPRSGTVFHGESAVLLTRQCSRIALAPVTGVWEPAAAQIAALEPKLADLLAVKLASRSDIGFMAADFYRQYGGLLVGRRKIIYVNGFHRELIDAQMGTGHITNWHTVPVQVCDGGALTFGVEYDPATGRFANFAFSGTI